MYFPFKIQVIIYGNKYDDKLLLYLTNYQIATHNLYKII